MEVYNSIFLNLHGSHTLNTGSSNNKKQVDTMTAISNEMNCYFKKLTEPLVTNKSLEDLYNKLEDDLSKIFDEKIFEQNVKIEELESIISIHENTIDQLLVKCDD